MIFSYLRAALSFCTDYIKYTQYEYAQTVAGKYGFNLILLENELHYVEIRLVSRIVFFCIYFSQAAFFRPAGG